MLIVVFEFEYTLKNIWEIKVEKNDNRHFTLCLI